MPALRRGGAHQHRFVAGDPRQRDAFAGDAAMPVAVVNSAVVRLAYWAGDAAFQAPMFQSQTP